MRRFTLPKKSRLKSQKVISLTISEGKSLQAYPVRVYFQVLTTDNGTPVKTAFAVSKRNFKRAVDRNRIKRLMREAYRLNQCILGETLSEKTGVNLVFLYYHRELLPFSAVQKATQKVLRRLARELQDDND